MPDKASTVIVRECNPLKAIDVESRSICGFPFQMNVIVIVFVSSNCVSVFHLLSLVVFGILTISGVLETLCDACAVLVRQHVPWIVRQAINSYVQVKTTTVVF